MDRLFSNLNKKLVIGSSLKEVDTVLRSYTIRKKENIFNVENHTILSLAKQMLRGSHIYSKYKLLSNEEASTLFYIFLKDKFDNNEMELIPIESFSFETSSNAYNAINKIRYGFVKKNDVNKVSSLIKEFDEYLIEKKYLDEPLIIKSANECMESDSFEAKQSFSLGNSLEIYLLPSLNNRLTYLEKSFIKGLECVYDTTVNVLVYDKFNIESQKRYKVPAYGFSNSVRYIVNEIKNKKLNLGDVAVYSSTNSYNNLFKAYFENNGINYKFENGESAAGEDIIGFMKSILDLYRSHFEIKHLYDIYTNKTLGHYKDKDGEVHSYSYTKDLQNLSANPLQIKTAVNRYIKGTTTYVYSSERRNFVTELVDIYNIKDSTIDIFKKVFDFTFKYTKSESHKYVKDPLNSKIKLFEYFDGYSFSKSLTDDSIYEQKIDFIKSVLDSIKIVKENDEKSSYVIIDNINAKFLPRKYNFFVGLSSNELYANEIESPLLSDDELNLILNCDSYYVAKEKNKNKELLEDLYNLLETNSNASIYFIASIYDSVEFRDLAKSAAYLNFNGVESPVFVDSSSVISITKIDSYDNYVYPRIEKNDEKIANSNLSPSSIEEIVNCPLSYIYQTLFEGIELDEYSDRWLKGPDEGTLTHLILQKYISEKPTSFDEAQFNKAFNEASNKFVADNPFDNETVVKNSLRKTKEMVIRYLDRYFSEPILYTPIAFELDLNDADSADYSRLPPFKIHGVIDRVDAEVDINGDLHLRIIDYKTYSSIDDHIYLQSALYPLLLDKYINSHVPEIKVLLKKEFNVRPHYDIEFIYEMIKLNCTYKPNQVEMDDLVYETLSKFSIFRDNPTIEEFEKIYVPEFVKKTEYDGGKCEYCKFYKQCKYRIEKGYNKVWKKEK